MLLPRGYRGSEKIVCIQTTRQAETCLRIKTVNVRLHGSYLRLEENGMRAQCISALRNVQFDAVVG